MNVGKTQGSECCRKSPSRTGTKLNAGTASELYSWGEGVALMTLTDRLRLHCLHPKPEHAPPFEFDHRG